MKNHNAQSPTGVSSNACTSCDEQHLKCDEQTPCRPCVNSSNQCSRLSLNHEQRTDENPAGNGWNSYDHLHSNNPLPTPESQVLNDADAGLLTTEEQPTWVSPPQGVWPYTYLLDPNAERFSANGDTSQVLAWMSGPVDQDHTMSGASAARPEQQTFLPLANISDPFRSNPNASEVGSNTSPLPSNYSKSHTPLWSISYEDDTGKSLHNYLNESLNGLDEIVQIFFAKISPHWPILHAPIFDKVNTSKVLLGAIVMLVSWLEGDEEHHILAPLVSGEIITTLLVGQITPEASDANLMEVLEFEWVRQ